MLDALQALAQSVDCARVKRSILEDHWFAICVHDLVMQNENLLVEDCVADSVVVFFHD